MPTARGKAAALGKISSMFQDVGRTATDIFKQRAVEKRRIAEEEKEKPFDELRKRLLSSQVESAELGTQQRQSDIESDKEIEDFMNSISASDEEKQMAKTSTMKSNELLNLLKSAKENPQETIQEYAEFLRPDTEIGKQVRSSLNPGQVAALDAILGQEQPEDAVKRMAPIVDEDTEIGKQARVTEAFDPTEPGAFDEKPLQPGERAPVKPQTSTFRFDDKTEEPEKVTRARKIVRELEGKRPTEKQKSLVKRNQAIIDKFEGRQEKLGDVAEERKFQLSLFDKKMNAQRQQAEKKANELAKKDLFNKSDKLRDDFDKLSKTFNEVNNAYGRIQASVENPSAAGDLSLIFNYMKILDPGSVVRESEFANAAASGSLGDRWVAVGKKLLSGERLAPDMRNDFVDRSNRLFKKASETQQKNIDRFTSLANKFNVEPELVVKQIDGIKQETTGTPTISSDEEYDKLPSGAKFIDPDGNLRRKP